jgi:hypothetical protein
MPCFYLNYQFGKKTDPRKSTQENQTPKNDRKKTDPES